MLALGGGGGPDDGAAGEDDLVRGDVVAGPAVQVGEEAHAPAQHEPADAHVGVPAPDHGQLVRLQRRVHVAPAVPGPDDDAGPVIRDGDLVEELQGDGDAAAADAARAREGGVAARLDGEGAGCQPGEQDLDGELPRGGGLEDAGWRQLGLLIGPVGAGECVVGFGFGAGDGLAGKEVFEGGALLRRVLAVDQGSG